MDIANKLEVDKSRLQQFSFVKKYRSPGTSPTKAIKEINKDQEFEYDSDMEKPKEIGGGWTIKL